jgi:penicillin-binding protein 1A
MKRFRIILTFFILCIISGSCAAGWLYHWAAAELPGYTNISDYRPALVTTILARDNSVLGLLYDEKRYPIPLADMPKNLSLAFLAIEDAEFYQHIGVSPAAILRAFIANIRAGKTVQGGSTITQQLIKMLVLTPERTFKRKAQEAILAYRLENNLSKDEVLSIYLNHVFLGANSYGVEAAARNYFAKYAKSLTLAECALIAGLPQSPSKYNPYRYPDAAKTRQLNVLRRMREMRWITDAEYENAAAEPLVYKSIPEELGPEVVWYKEEVRRRLIGMFSETSMALHGMELPAYGRDAVYTMGLTVYTCMDPKQQIAADHSLRAGLERASKRSGWAGPVERIAVDDFEKLLSAWGFHPRHLSGGGWVRALVINVTEKGAAVRLGSYNGYIDVKTMSWARQPNINVAAAAAPSVKDARNVLKVGDVVWASAVNTDEEPYIDKNITEQTVIALALEQYPEIQGSLVSMEPETGDVVAMVGGYNFSDSHFIRATQAKRQPGSSFKPIVYSAALDSGFTAGSIVKDAPVVFLGESALSTWRPKNYEEEFRGDMLLRTALALSRNLCTIRVAQQIGIQKVIDRARILGLEGDFQPQLSVSLGAVEVTPLNLTQAYTAFANEGMVTNPRFISKVTDSNGNVLFDEKTVSYEAISPQNAYIMASMLKDVVTSGTGTRAAVLGRPVGGKTGTSNDEQDAWFFAITPHLVTGVFVGYDQPRPMGRHETGGLAAVPIYVDYAKIAFNNYAPDDFRIPPDITMFQVEEQSSAYGREGGTRTYTLPLMTGTFPDGYFGLGGGATKPSDDILKQIY